MKWSVLLVVCEVVAYRPELPPQLTVEAPPCRQVEVQELCEVKLEAQECLHVTDIAPRGRFRGRSGARRGKGASSAKCVLEGPEEGFAVLYGVSNNDAVSLRGQGPWQISGGIHFHRLRIEVTALEVENARLAFFNASARKDGGAISAGRGGLKLQNSSVQVVSSNATRGGAIAVSSRGVLRCEGSTIVTERSYARMDGGSIFAKNVRLENSSVEISYAWARNGGGILADMLVARSSSLSISNAFAYGHGGATYSHKRLVLIDSRLHGQSLDASQTLASKGGGIYAFHLELRNSSVEIDDAASGFDGSCIHAVRSMTVRGSAVHLSGCRAKSQAALHVGGDLQMVNSSMTCHNSSAQSSGALHAEKVFLNSSSMKMTQIRSQVPPVALEVSIFKMTGSALSLLGTGGHQGFSAIELSPNAGENRSFDMSQDSSLVITDFFSGILSDGGLVRLRNAQLQRLRYAVEMPRAEGLDVADSVLEDVSELAFSCGTCQHLALRRIVARRVGALLRAAELKKWSLQDVQARCSQRSQVACVQLASALVFLDPEPWRLENVSLEAENVSSDVAPVLLDVEGPKVKGSHITVSATCPAGSFSFTQESGSSISKTAELMAMFEMMRGAESPENGLAAGPTCCASTRTLPRTQRFLKRTFDFDFGIIPDMNISCDPATYPCVCTTNICDRQILKTSLVSTRVSCMSCPMGQYSLTPYTRALTGDDSGLLGSSGSVLEGDCLSCADVVTQVGKMPNCAGRSVRVPRGLMALRGNTRHGLRFYRCPNAGACPGGDMVVADNTRKQRCAGGYDDSSAGCTQCATGYGRQNLDPFECVQCGRWDLSLVYFLLLPVVPLLLAVRSASQTEKERMSMVIKVILSFGTFLATLQNILEQTTIYRELRTQLNVALGLLEAESEAGGATLLSASFDCLMGGHASRWHFLGLQTFHCLAFLLIFLVLEIYGLLSRSESFGASWLRRTLVLGNAFLPAIFASFLQWAPCFHMAKEPDGSFESFSVFQVTGPCGSGFGMPWMPLLGLSLFLLLGPLHWAFMVSQSRKWKNRKEYIGFLIAGYNVHCEWWEITVLLRKTFLIGALVLLPVSYAPMSLVIATVLIMLAALVGHMAMRPYVDPLMNLLEGGVLTYSMLALILTLYLMSESWTNTNKSLVFFILIGSNAVTCLLLLVVFLFIALRRQDSSVSRSAASTASTVPSVPAR